MNAEAERAALLAVFGLPAVPPRLLHIEARRAARELWRHGLEVPRIAALLHLTRAAVRELLIERNGRVVRQDWSGTREVL